MILYFEARANSGLKAKSLRRGDQSWVTVLPRSDGTAEPDFLCTRGAGVCERLLAILVQHPGAGKRQGRKIEDGMSDPRSSGIR